MATNTIVLIAVAALAILVLVIAAVAVTYQARTRGRDARAYAVGGQAEAAELRAVHDRALAEHDVATAYAAEVEAELTHTPLSGPSPQPTE